MNFTNDVVLWVSQYRWQALSGVGGFQRTPPSHIFKSPYSLSLEVVKLSDTLIHFPLYIGDYLKQTMSFTQSERGAYIDLCTAYINNNGSLKDDETLYILTRCYTLENRASVATVVERAFQRDNGYIISDSLNELILKQKALRQQRVDAGKKSAEKRAKFQRALQQSESESESESESKKDNTNVLSKEKPAMDVMAVYNALSIQQAPVDQFEEFWEQYGIKEGKDKCKKKYATLLKGGVKHEDIILGVKNYQQECVKQNRERKYIKKPLTFLNGGHWEDDYTNQQLNGGNKNGNGFTDKLHGFEEAFARLESSIKR